jgi:hypothetical protein
MGSVFRGGMFAVPEQLSTSFWRFSGEGVVRKQHNVGSVVFLEKSVALLSLTALSFRA